jgi:hypothetical protein
MEGVLKMYNTYMPYPSVYNGITKQEVIRVNGPKFNIGGNEYEVGMSRMRVRS